MYIKPIEKVLKTLLRAVNWFIYELVIRKIRVLNLKKAASQRIAVLLARTTETRASFEYGAYLNDIVNLMNTLEKQDYSDNQTCVQPINFDSSKDSSKITRAKDLNEWFTVLYKRVYWMFRYCDSGSAKKYQKQLKAFARRVQKGDKFSFMTITDEDIENELSSGKIKLLLLNANQYLKITTKLLMTIILWTGRRRLTKGSWLSLVMKA